MKKFVLAFALSLPLLAAGEATDAAVRRPLRNGPVQFSTGQAAMDQMFNLTNGVLDWNTLTKSPATLAGFFETNQVVPGVGFHRMNVRITTPHNAGRIVLPNNSFQTFDRLLIEFALPVSAVALNVQSEIRFGWNFTLEAFDSAGTSLGATTQSGYQPSGTAPPVFIEANAGTDRISSIRITVPTSGLPLPGVDFGTFTVGMVQLYQTPLN